MEANLHLRATQHKAAIEPGGETDRRPLSSPSCLDDRGGRLAMGAPRSRYLNATAFTASVIL